MKLVITRTRPYDHQFMISIYWPRFWQRFTCKHGDNAGGHWTTYIRGGKCAACGKYKQEWL